MTGMMIAFVVWGVLGLLFIGMGIYAFYNKKATPMGFWANAEMFEVTDVKKYNRAMGKLFCTYGVVFMLLGLPLFAGQNSGWIILSVLGVMAESIVTMGIYTVVIEKKYKKK